MAQFTGRVVGDYLMGRQIGSGSFSVVWEARHRVDGTEVAIKEIAMDRLNKKLQESLMSEIYILRRINHPNIIRMIDMIKSPGKVHLVLEYCKGGDLSVYVQRRGSVPEATAKHFMQQLAAGLQVLRDNNIIHRDLKPQNLLLSTDENDADLKIADFGFARSLQPRGLAETLCGSPLYMAPEIMQLQKYDAKADLWSVGAILFQLVTGRTPFTGNSQIQLLQNIIRSTELHFPADCRDLSLDCIDLCKKLLRRNPVERLTFEEFFNHPFLSDRQAYDFSRSRLGVRTMDGFLSSGSSPSRNMEESSQEDCLPFFLDDDSSGPDGSPSNLKKTSSMMSSSGFNVDTRAERREAESSPLRYPEHTSEHSRINQREENDRFRFETQINSDRRNRREPTGLTDTRSLIAPGRVDDSQDSMDQDFVLVSGPPVDMPSSSSGSSKPYNFPFKSPPVELFNRSISSTAPMPITGATGNSIGRFDSLDSQNSAPSTSHGSLDLGDAFEQPSTHSLTRIRSLRKCAATITELVHERIESDKHLEAFSIQLAILAIWKQALHICHTQAISALEGSPNQDINRLRSSSLKYDTHNSDKMTCLSHDGSEEMSSQIQRQFIQEIELAEELGKSIEPGNIKMPDAMETIFEAALDLGKLGGVKEYMGDTENAGNQYSKAVRLLVFLLVEAPMLILNPPLSLTNSVRYRLRTYIDFLSRRLKHLQSHRKSSGGQIQGSSLAMMNRQS
ncbi:PREDICTED: serine/threonine-protein kinase ATG1c isoform X2 [Camelina sativa]|uniref:Serine/threonine-protein kinase ATG1c isoform X2 n=1 Tax=Camelina sativa TaxID=90675 RepID=A0ABM1RU22_CAMSA|nr:PREDICTED: serine/threonine-protein kinase ATG1c isoform X2 [Camelina sativa]